MKGYWAGPILCLLAALFLIMSVGCSAFNTPERRRMRAYTIRTDMDRAVDDISWILGWDRPSVLYDETNH